MKLSFQLFLLLSASASTASIPCDGSEFELSLTTDNYADETSWTLSEQDSGNVVASAPNGYYFDNSWYGQIECIDPGCYVFDIYDGYGNGICCTEGYGGYSISVDGEVVGAGGFFMYSMSTPFCTTSNTVPCDGNAFELFLTTDGYGGDTSWTLSEQDSGIVVASAFEGTYSDHTAYLLNVCVDPGCYNFVISDYYGNGLCCQWGNGGYSIRVDEYFVGVGSVFNFSETTQFCASDTVTCVGSEFELSLTTDNYGGETSWTLLEPDSGNVVASALQGTYSSNAPYVENACVDPGGCYVFVILDSYGDGMSEGNGGYSISIDGEVVGAGGNFGSFESTQFCITLPPVTPSPPPSASPSLTPSSVPSSKPSLTPSFVPSSKPSLTPSFVPSSNPSTNPSVAPSSNNETCEDSQTLIAYKGSEYTCEQAAGRCSNEKVASHCPFTCNACDMYGCEDSQVNWRINLNGRSRRGDCTRLDEFQDSCNYQYPKVASTCRESCNYCS